MQEMRDLRRGRGSSAAAVLAFIALVAACAPTKQPTGPEVEGSSDGRLAPAVDRPNFLLIITDDQRYDSFGPYMPITHSRIAQEGVEFTRAYVTTPICCPSRASILTGMYAHRHGVQDNRMQLLHPTFVERLHEQGYFTAMVGKYLNSWEGGSRPEFDYWVSWFRSTDYVDPRLYVGDVRSQHSGYVTYLLRDFALSALSQAEDSGRPFLLILSHKAPHAQAIPAFGDQGRYAGIPLHRPPSFNETDMSDKPPWLPANPIAATTVDDERQAMLESLWSVDQVHGAVLDRLEEMGELDNTVIFFLSDNGLMWGEHRLSLVKNYLYEEAARVPFAVRYPPLIPAPRIDDRLVANIDIAPTIYELAGIPPPAGVDGRSLVPFLSGGGGTIHADILLETWDNDTKRPLDRGVHTGTFLYAEREGYIPELYDLVADPYELQNVALDPAYSSVVADLRARLAAYVGGPAPPPPPPPPPPTGITLTATLKTKAGGVAVLLRWSGAIGTQVEIYYNGALLRRTKNDGQHQERPPAGATGPVRYRLCESPAVCSAEQVVILP